MPNEKGKYKENWIKDHEYLGNAIPGPGAHNPRKMYKFDIMNKLEKKKDIMTP